MPEIGKRSPSITKANVVIRPRRHRGNPSFHSVQKPFRHQQTDRRRKVNPISSEEKVYESSGFMVKDESRIKQSALKEHTRFERNLPFQNIPQLNPPFGESGDHFMEFLSQIGSNNRPFADMAFGGKSDVSSGNQDSFHEINSFFEETNDNKIKRQSIRRENIRPETDQSHAFDSFRNSNIHLNNPEDMVKKRNTVKPDIAVPRWTSGSIFSGPSEISHEHNSGTKSSTLRNGEQPFFQDDYPRQTDNNQLNNPSILNEIDKLQKSYQNKNSVDKNEYPLHVNPFPKKEKVHNPRRRIVHHKRRRKEEPLPVTYDPYVPRDVVENALQDENQEEYIETRLSDQEHQPIKAENQELVRPNALISEYPHFPVEIGTSSGTTKRSHTSDSNNHIQVQDGEKDYVPRSRLQPSEYSKSGNRQAQENLEGYHYTTPTYRAPIGSKQEEAYEEDISLEPIRKFQQELRKPWKLEKIAAKETPATIKDFYKEVPSRIKATLETTSSPIVTSGIDTQSSPYPSSTANLDESQNFAEESKSQYNEFITTPKTKEIYTPGPVYYKDLPGATTTPDPAILLDNLTAPPSKDHHKNRYKTQHNHRKIPKIRRIDDEKIYYKDYKTSTPANEGYYYRDINYHPETVLEVRGSENVDKSDVYPELDENPSGVADDYYYKGRNYETHFPTEIDRSRSNDWIPIPTRKHDLIRERLQKSPLKKLVNNVKESLFRSDAGITTAAAISLPYLALALPN